MGMCEVNQAVARRMGLGLVAALLALLAAGSPASAATWDELDAQTLWRHAGRLIDAGTPEAEADLRDLAAHVAGRYPEVTAAGDVAWGDWEELTRRLAPYLSEADREAWIERLQSATADAEALAEMSLEAAEAREAMLKHLGVETQGRILAEWTAASELWQDLEDPQLVNLLAKLRPSRHLDAATRTALATHVERRWLSDAAAARRLDPHAWWRVMRTLIPAWDESAQARWAGVLEQAYLGEGRAVTDLNPHQINRLQAVLTDLGQEQHADLMARWLESTDRWHDNELRELAWLAGRLSQAGEAAASARAELAEVAEGRLAASEHLEVKHLQQWWRLVRSLGGEFDDQRQERWVQGLRAAYTGADAEALNFRESETLARTLAALGDPESDQVLLDPTQERVRTAANQLMRAAQAAGQETGDAGRQARREVAEQVRSQYLADLAGLRQFTVGRVKRVLDLVDQDLDEAQRQTWAQDLRRLTETAIDNGHDLSPQELLLLTGMLEALGDYRTPELVMAYIQRGRGWRAGDLSPLCGLAGRLRALGAAGEPALERLREHLETTWVSAPALNQLEPRQWRRLAETAAGAPQAQRQRWADELVEAVAADEATLAATTPERVRHLVAALEVLKDPRGPELAWQYLHAAEGLDEASLPLLVGLVGRALDAEQAEPEQRRALVQWAGERWQASGTDKPTQALTIAWHWQAVGEGAKQQQWVLIAYDMAVGSEAARQSVHIHQLERLGDFLTGAGLAGPSHEYPEAAQALAWRARQGTLEESKSPELLAPLVLGEQSRAILEEALVDEAGQPRRAVAEALAHAYARTGQLEAWRSELDERIAASEGDAKAMWLVARSQAAHLDGKLFHRRAPLDAALAAAESEAVRLVVLEELAEYFRQAERPDLGEQLLASLEGQFEGEAAYRVKLMRRSLADGYAAHQAEQQRQAAESDLRRDQQLLEHLRESRRRAAADGDGEAAAQLSTRIQALEQELGQ